MVKLTPELIEQAIQFTNPVRDRELDLRGYKIGIIENMGATLDQYDTIDFSDNEIKKLDGFPLLKRLRSIMANNNQIVRVHENLEENLPNLETIILTNNNLQELGDLDALSTIKTLRTLSLLQNPVAHKKHYRLYVIHRIPQLRLLDFQKIKLREREAAAAMFKGKKGQSLVQQISKRSNTFVPGESLPGPDKASGPKTKAPTPNDRTRQEAIEAAIASAKTLEEVERIHRMLQLGQLPGVDDVKQNGAQPGGADGPREEEEEMET